LGGEGGEDDGGAEDEADGDEPEDAGMPEEGDPVGEDEGMTEEDGEDGDEGGAAGEQRDEEEDGGDGAESGGEIGKAAAGEKEVEEGVDWGLDGLRVKADGGLGILPIGCGLGEEGDEGVEEHDGEHDPAESADDGVGGEAERGHASNSVAYECRGWGAGLVGLPVKSVQQFEECAPWR